jgi:hypothetical protein
MPPVSPKLTDSGKVTMYACPSNFERGGTSTTVWPCGQHEELLQSDQLKYSMSSELTKKDKTKVPTQLSSVHKGRDTSDT